MYIGIDLGTSSIKAVRLNEEGKIIDIASEKLSISHPHPLYSEQEPSEWWHKTEIVIQKLSQRNSLQSVKAIGLTGQMHGAVLLNKNNHVLHPAILWNDRRCAKECEEIMHLVPDAQEITGNVIMPGFTAPKIKWIAKHKPEIYTEINKVLLPKDFLRFKMCGNFATDMSDASGTMWLDVAKRDWSDKLLDATGLNRSHMPYLFEGNEITGTLLPDVAKRWGIPIVPVIAGGGDNAAGALGIGLYRSGQAMLSLGSSGVYFVVNDGFYSSQNAVHSFCHILPNSWHLMSVMLNAANCLGWVAEITHYSSVPMMLDAIESQTDINITSPIFLPYLSGERTPHNDPNAKGLFWGLTHQHKRIDFCRAVLEGISFGLAEGIDALHKVKADVTPEKITLIGGGARNPYWRQILADVTGQVLEFRSGGDVGPALGAARLAQIALNPSLSLKELLPELPLEHVVLPNEKHYEIYQERRQSFSKIYQTLKSVHLPERHNVY
ncbi:xylulokinase [Photorhabdus heterorhabditis]|uniref:xylulokinase n=1 Tax=Photorhabdus heterorhabditis TaxID=880156 RepID=UPI0015622D7A|nr:xylulokinase [Photorhabdus heterorhabditis]NRN26819.1 xylulokinase [Photorhabdus heterorhabditis subsp. aluminescens]